MVLGYSTQRPAAVNAGATAGRSTKRKRDYLLFTDQTIITVKVGADEDVSFFNVHKELLCNHSTVFDEFLNRAPAPDSLSLPTTPEVFQTFLHWLYSKALVVDGLDYDNGDDDDDDDDEDEDEGDEDESSAAESAVAGVDENASGRASDVSVIENRGKSQRDGESSIMANGDNPKESWYSGLNKRGRVFGRLVDLYIFADINKSRRFKTDVILEWQRFSTSKQTIPCPTVVKRALDHLDMESPLCQLLILCYGRYTDYLEINKRRFSTLSPAFLTEVLLITFKRLDGDYVEDWDEDWCKFHEHQDREEEATCEGRKEKEKEEVRMAKKTRAPRGFCC